MVMTSYLREANETVHKCKKCTFSRWLERGHTRLIIGTVITVTVHVMHIYIYNDHTHGYPDHDTVLSRSIPYTLSYLFGPLEVTWKYSQVCQYRFKTQYVNLSNNSSRRACGRTFVNRSHKFVLVPSFATLTVPTATPIPYTLSYLFGPLEVTWKYSQVCQYRFKTQYVNLSNNSSRRACGRTFVNRSQKFVLVSSFATLTVPTATPIPYTLSYLFGPLEVTWKYSQVCQYRFKIQYVNLSNNSSRRACGRTFVNRSHKFVLVPSFATLTVPAVTASRHRW